MEPQTKSVVGDRSVLALANAAGVGDEARALVEAESTPASYIPKLVEHGLLEDAIRVLTALLPAREAIWWGWVCARKAAGEEPAPEIAVALGAIEQWLREPTDKNRRAAMEAGEIADLASPVGCVAMATFFSGGSIAPPDVDPVDPPPNVANRTLAAGILLSAVMSEPELAPEKLKAFVDQGVHVAKRVGAIAG